MYEIQKQDKNLTKGIAKNFTNLSTRVRDLKG